MQLLGFKALINLIKCIDRSGYFCISLFCSFRIYEFSYFDLESTGLNRYSKSYQILQAEGVRCGLHVSPVKGKDIR